MTADPKKQENVLSYQPPHEHHRRALFSIPAFAATAVVTTVVAFVLAIIVPRFEQIFLDFGMELPGSTKMLLSVSRWFVQSNAWLTCWAVPVAVGFGGALIENRGGARSDQPRRNIPWFRIAALIFMLFILVCVVAIGLPILNLYQSLH